MALDGKRIVIIGGASGLGYAVAEGALAGGAQVVLASSNPSKVEAAVARLGPKAQGGVVDVTREAHVATFFAGLGPFDHLVFTAGDWNLAMRGAPLAETELDAMRGLFEIRFWGALSAVKHAHTHIRSGGSVILTGGTIAHRPGPNTRVNTAMAGAVEHLTRGLAVDLAPIRVNAVCPGLTRTEIWDELLGKDRDAAFRGMTERQLLPRPGEPEEVAQAYLYLMRAGYTTGQVVLTDGGATVV
jgi:NAD(P)-dependent dehydrogenase (short-subunit alcohol dehydrogenase family)